MSAIIGTVAKALMIRVAFLSLGLAIPFLALEALSRFLPLEWSEERARFYQYDAELGWRGKPNTSGIFRTLDFTSKVILNSHGLRSPEIGYEKESSKRRILVLGDSFVWGYGVSAEHRFTEKLQVEMADSTVINAGCSGYGTDQELLFFRSEGRRYSADVVAVAVHLRSDVLNNVSSRQYDFYKPVAWSHNGELIFRNVPVVRSSWGYAAAHAIKKRSVFFVWLFARQLGEKTIGRRFADGVNRLIGDSEPPEIISNYTAVEATCTLASALASDIKSSNARAIFIVIPDIRSDTRLIDEKPEYFAVRECLSKLDAQVVDLTETLSTGLVDDAKTPIVFKHDRHWTPHGHTLVAKELAKALAAG